MNKILITFNEAIFMNLFVQGFLKKISILYYTDKL